MGAPQMRVGRWQVALGKRDLGQLAVVVRNGSGLLRQAHGAKSLVSRRCLGPVTLDLVDAHEVGERHSRFPSSRGKLLKQLLGTVIETGPKIVARKLVERRVAMPLVDVVARNDVLMHLDGAVDFAAASVEAPKREVRVDGLVVDRGQSVKNLERSIRLFIEQVTQTLQVTLAPAHTAPTAALLVPDGRPPAGRQRARERQPEDRAVVRRHPAVEAQRSGGL